MVDVKKLIVAFEMHKMELRFISKADTVTVFYELYGFFGDEP